MNIKEIEKIYKGKFIVRVKGKGKNKVKVIDFIEESKLSKEQKQEKLDEQIYHLLQT